MIARKEATSDGNASKIVENFNWKHDILYSIFPVEIFRNFWRISITWAFFSDNHVQITILDEI